MSEFRIPADQYIGLSTNLRDRWTDDGVSVEFKNKYEFSNSDKQIEDAVIDGISGGILFFRNVTLKNVTIKNCVLGGFAMEKCTCFNVKFEKCTFEQVSLKNNITACDVVFAECRFCTKAFGGKWVGQNDMSFIGCDFKNANFGRGGDDSFSLGKNLFSKCNFDGADFTNVRGGDATILTDNSFENCNFNNARLPWSNMFTDVIHLESRYYSLNYRAKADQLFGNAYSCEFQQGCKLEEAEDLEDKYSEIYKLFQASKSFCW